MSKGWPGWKRREYYLAQSLPKDFRDVLREQTVRGARSPLVLAFIKLDTRREHPRAGKFFLACVRAFLRQLERDLLREHLLATWAN